MGARTAAELAEDIESAGVRGFLKKLFVSFGNISGATGHSKLCKCIAPRLFAKKQREFGPTIGGREEPWRCYFSLHFSVRRGASHIFSKEIKFLEKTSHARGLDVVGPLRGRAGSHLGLPSLSCANQHQSEQPKTRCDMARSHRSARVTNEQKHTIRSFTSRFSGSAPCGLVRRLCNRSKHVNRRQPRGSHDACHLAVTPVPRGQAGQYLVSRAAREHTQRRRAVKG